MAENDGFTALVLDEADGKVTAEIRQLDDDALPGGDVTVAVAFSTLNYKDGMILGGLGRIVRSYPHVPGIDFAGTVEASDSDKFKPGDKVILTGWRVGEIQWGGYATRARVKADWLVPLPAAMTLKQAMAIGTAGFTATLALIALEEHGLTPESEGEVLVTGAAGGAGSIAAALLGSLAAPLGAVAGLAPTAFGAIVVGIVKAFASVPGATLDTQLTAAWVWAGYTAIAVGIAIVLRGRWLPVARSFAAALWLGPRSPAHAALLVAGLAVIAAAPWSAVASNGNDGLLRVYFLDVGQGDATLILSPNGAAVLIFPIVMATARQLNVNPEPFVLVLMVAAGSSFMSPVAYQTNLMVYGPGGYRFMDFVRLGLPLTLLVAIISTVFAPLFFPFYP